MGTGKVNTTQILSKVHRLLIGFLVVSVLVAVAIVWDLLAHKRVDDLNVNYHNQSTHHIDHIRYQFLLIKSRLDRADQQRMVVGYESGMVQHDQELTEAIYIASTHAKELRLLQKQYRVKELGILAEQLLEMVQPIFVLLEPGKDGFLEMSRVKAVILKLNQMERQHRISSDRLRQQTSQRERLQRWILVAFLGAVAVVFGLLAYRIVRDIRNLIRLQQQSETDLFQEKELLRTTLESIGDAVITTDSQGWVTSLNPVAEKLTGWSSTEAKGREVHDVFPIIDASTREPIANPVEKVIASGETVYLSNHTTLISRNGEEYHIADSAAPIRADESDDVQGMVLVFNDVTEQYRLRVAAAKDRRNLRAIMDFSPTLVQVRDLEGRYQFVNRKFERELDREREHVIGRTPLELFSRERAERIVAYDKSVIESGEVLENHEDSLEFGNGRSYMTTTFPLLDGAEKIYAVCSISSDITARKLQEEKILYQAHYDALTGLPNRFLSMDRLTQLTNEARRHGHQVAVLFIDLDDFKKVNDTLGHETGDKLLVNAAEHLKTVVRGGDTVGRLGGDEFIILAGRIRDATDATAVAENVIDQFRRPFNIDGREMVLTGSIGLALFPTDGDNASQLLRSADAAMYHAKERGRNTYSFFTEAMNKEVSRRLALEEQLHGALDRGEFSVVYQPQVSIRTGRVHGAEALLRWKNAALGIVPPDEFIPIAEQTGIIIQLGEFVLENALRNASGWIEKHDPDFRVAVNVSPRQFRDPGMVGHMCAAIEACHLSGRCLELEITEGVLLTGMADIHEVLDSLRELGVSIALDDFGTGYSSLSYLRMYPFDVLKIDRSFINDITEDPSDLALVNAAIAMARALGLSVVAEGVETEEQLSRLRQLGCDSAQGYHISKPLEAEALIPFLQQAVRI